jgi:hypothetical protein
MSAFYEPCFSGVSPSEQKAGSCSDATGQLDALKYGNQDGKMTLELFALYSVQLPLRTASIHPVGSVNKTNGKPEAMSLPITQLLWEYFFEPFFQINELPRCRPVL